MLRDAGFWEKESASPLMSRNANYVTNENAEIRCLEMRTLLDFIPSDVKEEMRDLSVKTYTDSGNDEMNRLFYLDAERTFCDESHRQKEVSCLNTVYHVIKDYHQGLGFIVAFLLLFLPREEVTMVCLYLDKCLLKGYIKAHNHAYLRDAIVFERILRARDPNLADHLADFTVPGAYCSKWFIGMNLHVLPFEALVRWFHVLLSLGQRALFQYGLSVCLRNRDYLMRQKQAAKVLELLRFDKSTFSDDKQRDPDLKDSIVPAAKAGSYYLDIVEHAIDLRVEEDEIEMLRHEVEREMEELEERRGVAEAQYSSDEITFSDEECN